MVKFSDRPGGWEGDVVARGEMMVVDIEDRNRNGRRLL